MIQTRPRLSKHCALTPASRVFAGMPHPAYFPFSAVHVDALVADSFAPIALEERRSGAFSWLWNLFGSKEKTIPFTVKKYPEHPEDNNLAVALQYGTALGSVQLRETTKTFAARVHQPAYEDWEILMHTGNTDA